MVRSGEVEPQRLGELFAAIEPHLIRFPAISAEAFRAKVERFLSSIRP
jgi:hypothetical protein